MPPESQVTQLIPPPAPGARAATTTRTAPRVPARRPSRDQLRRRLLAFADMAAIWGSLAFALVLTNDHSVGGKLLWGTITLPAWLVLVKVYGLYDRDTKRVSHSTVDDIPQLFHAVLVGTVLLWLFFEIGPTQKVAFLTLLVFGVSALVAVVLARWLVRTATRRLLAPERALILGDGELSEGLVRKMRSHPEYALEPIAVVKSVSDTADFEALAEQHRIDRLIITDTRADSGELVKLLSACRRLALKVSIVPTVFEAIGPATEIDDVEGVTVLGLNPPALSRSSRLIKRAIDVAVAGLLLTFSLPLLLAVALAIKLDSSGPVLFAQRRIGKNGRPFRMIKFRTMVVGAERLQQELQRHSADPHWVMLDHDPRITRVGALLRRTSIDELPQLWNVLTGKMSLVGPRPLPEYVDTLIEGWGRGRLDLMPGMTGYWQVLGRANIPFTEMVKLDYIYVTNWSLWTDIRLLLRTLPAVLSGRGVR